MNASSENGFTLMEVLIAMVIFALLSIIIATSLRQILFTHSAIKSRQAQLQTLLTIRNLISHDLENVINRSVIAEDGAQLPGLMMRQDKLELTRLGAANPDQMPNMRAMVRLRYQVLHGNLVRLIWRQLDRPEKTVPIEQIVCEDVQSIHFLALDQKYQFVNTWPISETATSTSVHFPLGIEVRLNFTDGRSIVYDINIKARGYYEKNI